jgi:hypothetical protein
VLAIGAGEAGGLERLPESSAAFPSCRDSQLVAQMGHPAVALPDQMLGRAEGSLEVVGEHRIGEHAYRRPIDEDHGRALFTLGLQVAVVTADHGQDQPVDPPPRESRDQRSFPLLIVFRTGGEHGSVPRGGHPLDRPVDGGGERVVHRVQQQSEGVALAIAAA